MVSRHTALATLEVNERPRFSAIPAGVNIKKRGLRIPACSPAWEAAVQGELERELILELRASRTSLVELVVALGACLGIGFSIGLGVFTPFFSLAILFGYVSITCLALALLMGSRKRKNRRKLIERIIEELNA